MKLSDFMIMSDMDGTLLGPDGHVPQRNLDAIQRFTQAGGRFGIATGRSRGLMLERVQRLPVNAPCILYNGGALYDFAGDRIMMQQFLPDAAARYLREIMRVHDGVGVLIISGDDYYQIRVEEEFAKYWEGREHVYKSVIEEVRQPWYKILFQVKAEEVAGFVAALTAMDFAGVRIVATNTTLVEMLPEGATKGYAVEHLIREGIVARECLAAIGDFYNDVEMIESAGIGVTLCTAPDDIKKKADLIVGDNAGGAVADLVEHLEALCIRT